MRRDPDLTRAPWQRYGLALLAVLFALAATRAGWAVFQGIPFMLPILAICVSGWFGGGGPGLLTTALSAVGVLYFFFNPMQSFRVEDPLDLVRLAVFVGVGAAISLLNAQLWRTRIQRAGLLEEETSARAAAVAAALDLQRLAAIVESSEDAIIGKDLDGVVTTWNPAAEGLFGYAAEEMIGRPISTIMPPERKSDMDLLLRRVRLGERIKHFETVRVRKDGVRVPVWLSVSPIKDRSGKIVGASKIARDISERLKAEEAILEANRQLELALSAARMGVWSWDLATGAVAMSAPLAALYGLSPEAFRGTYEAFLELVHPEDRELVDSSIRRAIDQKSIYDTEFRVPLAGGGIRWMTGHGQVFTDGSGAPSRVIGIGVDVTERRLAQEERERLYRETQEAVQARDAFLSVAGHEFRTPLGALNLSLHNLARRLGNPQDERIRRILDTALRQVERLTRLTEDLLEVGRINAGKLALEPEVFELGALVREVTQRLEETAVRSGCRFEIRAPAPVVGVWDRSRVDQVVTNLLTNAVKFGAGKPVEVAVGAHNGAARVTVRDHGIGIPPEDQARIFERFERATPSRSYQGMGLGLWIARQIVETHGGSIAVESRPGEGAEFRVDLPSIR